MGIDSRAGSTDDVKDNGSAVDLKEIFKTVQTILVIDWPSKELPETLTRAGFHVVVRAGPGPEDYSAYELHTSRDLALRPWRSGGPPHWPPARACRSDFSYRPLSELPEIITTAKRLGAQTIWTQSGLSARGHRSGRLGAARGTAAGAKPRGIIGQGFRSLRAIYRRRGSEVTEKVADGFCAVVDDRAPTSEKLRLAWKASGDWIGRVGD
jgi:hypothetical protein